MELVAFAKRNDSTYNYGQVFEIVKDTGKCIVVRLEEGLTTLFHKSEVYFPNHIKGYNQPCFK